MTSCSKGASNESQFHALAAWATSLICFDVTKLCVLFENYYKKHRYCPPTGFFHGQGHVRQAVA